jgi:hypothetical protein
LNQSKTPLPPKKLEIVASATRENNPTYEDFVNSILETTTLIGCVCPDTNLTLLLWQMYSLNFQDLNLWEFKLAFRMNLERVFIFEAIIENKRETIDRKNHYNNFSGEFMADVLEAYRKEKFKTIQEVKAMEVVNRPKLPVSDTATKKSTLERVIGDFTIDVLIFDTAKYDILIEFGIYNVSSEDKKKYMDKAKGILEASKVTVRNVFELKKITDVIGQIMAGDNKALIYDAKRLAYIDFLLNPENKIKVENQIKLINQS